MACCWLSEHATTSIHASIGFGGSCGEVDLLSGTCFAFECAVQPDIDRGTEHVHSIVDILHHVLCQGSLVVSRYRVISSTKLASCFGAGFALLITNVWLLRRMLGYSRP